MILTVGNLNVGLGRSYTPVYLEVTKSRPGNCYLKGAQGIAAMSAASSRDTYLAAKYRRIASRPNPDKTKQRALDQFKQKLNSPRPTYT